jgi:hypothetical protein
MAARFAWLHDPNDRPAALAAVHRAVRAGWAIDDEGRAEILRALDAMRGAPDLSPRDALCLMRVYLAMDLVNLRSHPGYRPRRPRASPDVRAGGGAIPGPSDRPDGRGGRGRRR